VKVIKLSNKRYVDFSRKKHIIALTAPPSCRLLSTTDAKEVNTRLSSWFGIRRLDPIAHTAFDLDPSLQILHRSAIDVLYRLTAIIFQLCTLLNLNQLQSGAQRRQLLNIAETTNIRYVTDSHRSQSGDGILGRGGEPHPHQLGSMGSTAILMTNKKSYP